MTINIKKYTHTHTQWIKGEDRRIVVNKYTNTRNKMQLHAQVPVSKLIPRLHNPIFLPACPVNEGSEIAG